MRWNPLPKSKLRKAQSGVVTVGEMADERTQYERMASGDLYIACDPKIAAEQAEAHRVMEIYNSTATADKQGRRKLLERLLGSVGKEVEIRSLEGRRYTGGIPGSGPGVERSEDRLHLVDPKPPHGTGWPLHQFPQRIGHLVDKEAKTRSLHLSPQVDHFEEGVLGGESDPIRGRESERPIKD